MSPVISKWLVPAGALLLAACGTPETDCRDGVKQMKTRTASFVGMGQPEDVRLAIEQVNSAETQLATGNYAGCLESLADAGARLNRSQRQNQ
jgi:hypothetical protein